VAFHYRAAEKEFGRFQAHELMVQLQAMLANVDVEVSCVRRQLTASLCL
jgi:trehalose-6-phosphatase